MDLISQNESCDNFAVLTIPELCKEVKNWVIVGCKNLTSIQIGKNLESFEYFNGYSCPMLKNITFDTENPYLNSEDGVLVNSVKAKAGQKTTISLQSGVYVINRKKSESSKER